MLSSKTIILCILEILERYSDKEHILNSQDIKSLLKSLYGVEIERKAIYRNISALCDFGYDISVFEENKKGYYMRERKFEDGEIRLLADAVYASKFIPTKATKDLINKLRSLQNVYDAKKIADLTIIKSTAKTVNQDIFYNIEIMAEAILKKKKVAFTYCKYDFNKNLIPRRTDKYIVNPYSIVWSNEHYYLLCNYDKYDNISHYRIDFIKDIIILEDMVKSFPSKYQLKEYSEKAIYMFGGDMEKIELLCENCILDDVIDKFGKEINITEHGKQHFKVTLTAHPKGVKFWALQYLNYCEVLSPKSLREEIKDNIQEGIKKYI